MRAQKGARIVPVSASQALNGTNLIGGPVRLVGWSLSDGSGSSDSFVDQSANAPGAGVTVATISQGNGVYQVQWTLELTGTPGAGDADNVALFVGATQIDQSVNAGAVGTYGPFTAEAQVTFGPLAIAAKAIGAATAGSVYRVRIMLIPIANSTCNILDGKMVIASPSILPQASDTETLGDNGIRVETGLSVQTIQGSIQGALWVELYHETARQMGE